MVGPNGERWVPVHTLVPHSKAESTLKAVKDLFAANQATLDEHNIGVGFLLATVSTNGFVIEPVFFTPDALNEIHKATLNHLGQPVQRVVDVVKTPSYKDEYQDGMGGWSVERRMPPKPLGAYWLRFYWDGSRGLQRQFIRAD